MATMSNILNIRFNYEHDCFACAMEDGVRVFNGDPLVEKTRIDFGTCGGIGYCEMLHRTNLLALVGGGQAPKFPESRVMVWDDLQSKFVYELNFKSKVLSIRMKKKRLISPGRSLISTLHWATYVSVLYTWSHLHCTGSHISTVQSHISPLYRVTHLHCTGSHTSIVQGHISPLYTGSHICSVHNVQYGWNYHTCMNFIYLFLLKRLFVVLNKEIHVFAFPHPIQLEMTVQTAYNPKGLFQVTPTVDKDIVFYPSHPADKCVGTVKVQDLSASPTISSFTIPAHQHSLAAIATNYEGTLIATASEKGTLIRVRDVLRNEPLAEFRRGADTAIINYLSFSPDSRFMCACSDKGTVHIFAVFNRELNKKSTFAGSGISTWYTDSQWGMAHVSLPKETVFVAALDNLLMLHVVCWDGSHFKYRFNPSSKDSKFCHQESYNMFLCVGDDSM